MSAAAQTAFMQEQLDLSHQFRANSAMRNGIPNIPPRNVINGDAFVPPAPKPAPPPAPQIVKLMRKRPEPTRQPVPSSVPMWAKAALVTSTLTIGGIGGALISGMGQQAEPPSAQFPSDTIAAPAVNGPADGDLLRWLRSQGYDRPSRLTPGASTP